MPVSYVNHKGREILYVDLTESKTEKRSLELLEETKEAYLNASDKLYVLVNSEGAFVNAVVSSKMKEYGRTYFKDRAEKRAFVGIHGLKKMILRAYSKMVGGNIKVFDDVEEAKDYLAS
ncbi:hypothetical protein [Ekhidna sp.]|uniref:hypothetical protein n=1 Tax=Ekhidna sp. TaxID=2608089 RepID=UPI003CCBCF27